MMKKLALFDMDGTLFNTSEINYHAYKEALNEVGFDIDHDYYCEFCNGRYYKVFIPDIVNNDEDLIQKVHERKKVLYKKYIKKGLLNVHLFNIIESIKDMYYVVLVTTASKKNTDDILEFFNKKSLFDLIITHEDIKNVKPNPECFLKAMDYFKINFNDTIIFEDSKIGIEAARATGASVVIIDKF